MKKAILLIIYLLGSINVFCQTKQVDKVSITVSNLEASLSFYQQILEFELLDKFEYSGSDIQRLFGIDDPNYLIKGADLKLGTEIIELLEVTSSTQGRKIPIDSKSNDLWFQHIAIVVSDMDKAYEKLKKHNVEYVSTGPQTLPDYIPAAAGISAFYFHDLDDNNLELIYFPEGKGNPKWQNSSKLFLGIDHTAIGIENTTESLEFYQEILGLNVAGNSENYGPEQEHLNQVFGARLLITGLHAEEKDIGVEFLDYLAPPGGRPYPKTTEIEDLWHWHIHVKVTDIEKAFKKAQEENSTFISNGIVELQNGKLAKKAFTIRDVDGHVILVKN